MTSAPEPLLFMPDGELSQVVAVARDRLVKRVGLPWPFAGSMFASDGENVACVVANGGERQHVDGLKMTTMASWLCEPRSLVSAMAMADGRLFLVGDYASWLSAVSVDGPIDPKHTAWSQLPFRHGPARFVRDRDRLLLFGAAAPRQRPLHGCCVLDLQRDSWSNLDLHRVEMAVEDEELRSVHVDGEHLVVHAAGAHADAVSFHDAQSFAVRFRIIRDATIPRWTAALCVDDTLVVTDDRPGLMIASVDALAHAHAACANPQDGARAAARALRATWQESPLGAVRRLERIPHQRRAIVVADARSGPSASLWTVPLPG